MNARAYTIRVLKRVEVKECSAPCALHLYMYIFSAASTSKAILYAAALANTLRALASLFTAKRTLARISHESNFYFFAPVSRLLPQCGL